MRKVILLATVLASTAGVWADGIRMLNRTTAEVTLDGGQCMYVDFYGPHTFRVFQDPNGGVIRDPQASPEAQILVNNPRREVGELVLDEKAGTLTTREIVVKVNMKTGQIQALKNGRVVVDQVLPTDFGKKRTTVKFAQNGDDYFYGGGVQNGRFSHKGKFIAIVNTNNWVDGGVCSPTPYYWSTGGYGVMWHTFKPGGYDFGAAEKDNTVLYHDTDYLDLFVMVNDGAVPLLNDFYQLTGNPVLLPKFGFYQGHLNAYNRDYWTEDTKRDNIVQMAYEDGKYYKESQKDNGGLQETLNGEKNNYQFSARAAIDRYLDNDFPLGWFLPNDGYGAGYGQTGSLDGNIQNLKEFGDYARSRGVEIGLWTQSDLHPKEGIEPLLQRDIVKEVGVAGVRVLKTDVAWVGAGYSFGLNGVADVGQIMPYYGNDARPFIISLDGWAGTQRYAGIWSGDQTGGEWEYIRFHIPTYIGAGLAGQPNITSDTDGIFGGQNLAVNVRDFQWKTYTPMQLNMDGWGSNPKYPQALGDKAAKLNRYYLKLKSRILPYQYSIAREAVDGKPMIRAMFLEEENAYTLGKRTEYQYMFGPNILVAPIYKETRADKDGNDVRDGIYLPKGEWVDYFTGDVYAGGRIINNYAAPLWKLPVLIKRGAIIPVHKATHNPSEMDPKMRAYEIYPMGETSFTEYDDDAKTQAYLRGESTTTKVLSNLDEKGNLTITVEPTKGGFEGFETQKFTHLTVFCSQEPAKVSAKVGGKKVKLTEVGTYAAWKSTPNSYYYGRNDEDEFMKASALMVNVEETDVVSNAVQVTASKVVVDNANKLLANTGVLSAPKAQMDGNEAYTLTPVWSAQDNADYYELEFEGQTYSTIAATEYTIDGLSADTEYEVKVRAVNKDGVGDWTTLTATTAADPLRFAVRGIEAETSCANQGGQGIHKMFDFDETSIWHTAWSQTAVPFDIIIDLRTVNYLDKMQYLPRPDSGNGTILKATCEVSMDRVHWSKPVSLNWERNGNMKEVVFEGNPQARYIRIKVSEAVGNYGSGHEFYIFRQQGSDFYIPGDINLDGKLDENDLTSYMNYTGLRKGDGDFDYVSKGDLNGNGLIEAYDIMAVAVVLEDGVGGNKVAPVDGTVIVKADKAQYNVGDVASITVSGKGLKSVNGISLALPYSAQDWEYVGVEAPALGQMYNMTYDRLHTNGDKVLYPTFVNLGDKPCVEGETALMVLKMKAKKKQKFTLEHTNGMLVDKYQNVVEF
ncbi:MAG: discoidin domain-containing protein [Bacteroides sp.]|nr:discoidin domain-containing protein [Bacteroides sp.]MCM1448554.1 discoidin domain-containing protein [Bacteroides sp.]